MRLKISEIVKAAGGKLLCGDGNTVVTAFFHRQPYGENRRHVCAYPGEKTDAHVYIDFGI